MRLDSIVSRLAGKVAGSPRSVASRGGAWPKRKGSPSRCFARRRLPLEQLESRHLLSGLPPLAPTALVQLAPVGPTELGVGEVHGQSSLIFRGTVSDPESDSVRLQVEVQPIGTAFLDSHTVQSPLLAAGSAAGAAVTGLADGEYHWQARAVDSSGVASPWTAFGANLESDADVLIDTSAPPPPPSGSPPVDSPRVRFDETNSSVDEAAGAHSVAVRLTADPGETLTQPVTVTILPQDGEALRTIDFHAASPLQVTFDPGDGDGAIRTFDLIVDDDLLIEGHESFGLSLANLSGPAAIESPAAHTVTILDDEAASVRFIVADSTAPESSGGAAVAAQLDATPATATLERPLSVSVVDLLSGTATETLDYAAFGSQSITFPAAAGNGDTQIVTVDVLPDNLLEGPQTVELRLPSATELPNVAIASPSEHVVTIVDDEFATVAFELATSTVAEGDPDPELRVVLHMPGEQLEQGVSLRVRDTFAGTAIPTLDYVPFPDRVVQFLPGAGDGDLQAVTLSILDDGLVESTKTIVLGLDVILGPNVTTTSPDTHTVAIFDNQPMALVGTGQTTVGCNVPVSFDAGGAHHANPARDIVRYEWDFDYDGATFVSDSDTGTDPLTLHTYLTRGVHTTAVRVTDDNVPPRFDVATIDVTVDFTNVPPTAHAGGAYTTSILNGVAQPLTLDGTASSDANAPCDSIVQHEWDLDYDGATFDVDETGATVAYADPTWFEGEIRSIGLRVTDSEGSSNTSASQVTVLDLTPPTVAPGGPYAVNEGLSLDLQGSCTGCTQIEWDFDYDGATFDVDATGPTPTFGATSIDGPRSFTAAVRAVDAAANVSTIETASLTVDNAPPTIASTPPTSAAFGQLYVYQATAADPAGTLDPLTWSLQAAPAGLTVDAISGLVEWPVPSQGAHPVTLRAADDDGGTADQDWTIVVDGGPPPDMPTNLVVSPPLPANENQPLVSGEAPPEAVAVHIYGDVGCDGPPLAIAPVSPPLQFSFPVPVEDDRLIVIRARAVDAFGNVSACSLSSAVYVEDSLPPQVTLVAPQTSSLADQSLTVIAGDAWDLPDGARVDVDVDLDGDGDFGGPGESSYATTALRSASLAGPIGLHDAPHTLTFDGSTAAASTVPKQFGPRSVSQFETTSRKGFFAE